MSREEKAKLWRECILEARRQIPKDGKTQRVRKRLVRILGEQLYKERR